MNQVVHLLIEYKYIILFPLAIIEGPILAIIAGFLCVQGFLNPGIVFPVIVLGDITGDSLCFALGRWGLPPVAKKILHHLGFNQSRKKKVVEYLSSRHRSMIPVSKITPGIGVLGIYLIGNSGMKYQTFIRICFITSFCQYIFYLGFGFLFGQGYELINKYINYTAALAIILFSAIFIFFIIQSKLKKI